MTHAYALRSTQHTLHTPHSPTHTSSPTPRRSTPHAQASHTHRTATTIPQGTQPHLRCALSGARQASQRTVQEGVRVRRVGGERGVRDGGEGAAADTIQGHEQRPGADPRLRW